MPSAAQARRVRLAGHGGNEKTQPPASHETHSMREERTQGLDDGEAPAPFEAAGLEHFAPGARAHPLHKAVLALTRDALRLPGSLHGLSQTPSTKVLTRVYLVRAGPVKHGGTPSGRGWWRTECKRVSECTVVRSRICALDRSETRTGESGSVKGG